MFTGISIYDVVTWIKDKHKKAKELKANREAENAAKEAEEEYEEDNKVVISSIDELSNKPINEVREEAPVENTVSGTYQNLQLTFEKAKSKTQKKTKIISRKLLLLI